MIAIAAMPHVVRGLYRYTETLRKQDAYIVLDA